MSSYGALSVDTMAISQLRNGVDNELLAVFRDDMLTKREVPIHEYYPNQGYDDEQGAELIEVLEFRADGHVIAQRLDALGITADSVADCFEYFLHGDGRTRHDPNLIPDASDEMRAAWEEDDNALDELTAELWVERTTAAIAATKNGSAEERNVADYEARRLWPKNVGSLPWLLSQVVDWFPPYALRALLLVFPDGEVSLDITELAENGWMPGSPEAIASQALSTLRTDSGSHAPTVVLTEGRTDAEFLSAGLELLFPHLTDVVKFLDYEARPEGGVGALVRLIHSFAAAGIANRVVAVFDNDTAAAEALRALNRSILPPNIAVGQYPDLDDLRNYPTLGPPTTEHPNGTQERANVNGMAASIELYLGLDVLTDETGCVSPVQWRSFSPGTGRYQGEVLRKGAIQTAFRAKVELCRRDPSKMEVTDWSGMRHILVDMLAAIPNISDPLLRGRED